MAEAVLKPCTPAPGQPSHGPPQILLQIPIVVLILSLSLSLFYSSHSYYATTTATATALLPCRRTLAPVPLVLREERE